MLKKILASLGTLALAVGMSVIAVAAPAAAHHATVTGVAACAPGGGWDVTWTIANSETRAGTIIESNRDVVPANTTVLPAKPAESATFTEHVWTNTSITLTVKTKWFKTSNSNSDVTDSARSFTVKTFPSCETPDDTVTCTAATVYIGKALANGNYINMLLTQAGQQYGLSARIDIRQSYDPESPTGYVVRVTSDTPPGIDAVYPLTVAEMNSGVFSFNYASYLTDTWTVDWVQFDGHDWHFTGTLECGDPQKDATGAFEFTPPTCDADGSYTLSGAVNATFTVFDGTTTTTGLGNSENLPAVTGKTYTITVVPNLGHSLTDATDASDSFSFTAAKDCRMEVALYVYKKLDPTKPASWTNSGKQTFITSKLGNTWYDKSSFPTLPTWVCGPAWGVQQDMVKDWDASKWDANSDDRFDWPTNITYPHDNIGWPPLYDAKHADLSTYTDIPDCVTTSGEPTYTAKSCQVDSKNWLTLPAVNGGEWIVTKGDTVLTYDSYEGGPADGFGTYTIELTDANPDDEYTVTPAQASWSWTAVDPEDLNCATAEDPNWIDQECNPLGTGTTVASYTIVPVTGVLYEVSLDDGDTWTDATPPGTDPVTTVVSTFTTKVMIRALPAEGYELVGTTESSHVFDAAVDCIDRDASAFIETTPPSCEAAGGINQQTVSLVHATWTTSVPTAPGKYDMVAKADEGHAFSTGETQLVFPLTIGEKLPGDVPPCDLPVLASVYPKVSSTPLTCTAAGTYTIGALAPDTVKWSVNGGPLIDGGTFTVNTAATISLVASPTNPEDTLATDDFDNPTWTNPVVLEFESPEEDCTTELTTLALTGIGSGMGLSLAGGLVLLGLGGLFVFARTRQTGRHAA